MNSTADLPKLTIRQQRFADLVLSGMSQTAAYIKAGYAVKGADAGASRMATHPGVSAYLETEREKTAERERIKKWEVLDFLSNVIRTPIGEVDESSMLAQEVTRDEIGEEILRTKIKMADKLGSVDRMAKILGWYAPEKHQHNVSDELADLIRETRAGNLT